MSRMAAMSPLAPPSAAERAPGSLGVLVALATAYFLFLLLPSLSPHYGFYSDELYYLACADRLAFGYVDQPPFFVFILRLWREIFGDSLLAWGFSCGRRHRGSCSSCAVRVSRGYGSSLASCSA